MPNINPAILPTAVLSALIFWIGVIASRRARSSKARLSLLALGAILAMPGALLDVYYLHVLDRAAWYFSLRAIPWIEVTAASAGFLGGAIWALATSPDRGRRLRLVGLSCLALMIFALLVPYAKQLFQPIAWPDRPAGWKDGVCLQSTMATCGPASAATMLRNFGIEATERELASEAFSTETGTECWYLARALRRRGVRAGFVVIDPKSGAIPCPAIAGQGLSGAGHFIVVLEGGPGGYVVADPLSGRQKVSEAELREFGALTGFFLTVRGPGRPRN